MSTIDACEVHMCDYYTDRGCQACKLQQENATLTAQLAEARAMVGVVIEKAADACADYPRVSPDYDEWTRYDEQIAHSQECIRAIDPDATAALSSIKREAEDAGIKIGLRAGATWLRTVPEELAHRQVYAAAILALTPDEARKLGEEE